MIAVSNAWREKQDEILAPEGFVEISYFLTEDGIQEEAVVSSAAPAVFSDVESIADPTSEPVVYATNELNLWTLDGTRKLLPDGVAEGAGYASADTGSGGATLTLAQTHTQVIPGITITWSTAYNEYPTAFTVTARRGSTVVATKTVTGNTSPVSVVQMDISNYNALDVTVVEWCLPVHRARIEKILFGYTVLYDKTDIISFEHEQTGCLSSGELPKNSIKFSLDNSNGRWNPNSPEGVERYLSDRQKLDVRYGFDIDGTVEWIKAGTFYLTDWKTPSNGLEASFEARDLLEFMLDEIYTGPRSGTLLEIADAAVEQAGLPYGTVVNLDWGLANYTTNFAGSDTEYTIAEILQAVANAGCCTMYQSRDGALNISREHRTSSGFTISQLVEHSHPEFELSKALRSVTVTGGAKNGGASGSLNVSTEGDGVVVVEDAADVETVTYTLPVSSSGENQTIDNELIGSEAQATDVAQWVSDNLRSRKRISGDYRADPRLDVFDNITVETKFGTIKSVVLTSIKYTFASAFRGSYSGVVSSVHNVSDVYCGEGWYAGEVP